MVIQEEQKLIEEINKKLRITLACYQRRGGVYRQFRLLSGGSVCGQESPFNSAAEKQASTVMLNLKKMETFTIKGTTDFITITFDEVYDFPDKTCYWGGYDTRVKIEIKSGNFVVHSSLYSSTGEIYEFYAKLKECNDKLIGTAVYKTYEHNLDLTISYDKTGHVNINGKYSDQNQYNNILQFEFTSDQTFIQSTIKELELIVDKYGDMHGIKKNK